MASGEENTFTRWEFQHYFVFKAENNNISKYTATYTFSLAFIRISGIEVLKETENNQIPLL